MENDWSGLKRTVIFLLKDTCGGPRFQIINSGLCHICFHGFLYVLVGNVTVGKGSEEQGFWWFYVSHVTKLWVTPVRSWDSEKRLYWPGGVFRGLWDGGRRRACRAAGGAQRSVRPGRAAAGSDLSRQPLGEQAAAALGRGPAAGGGGLPVGLHLVLSRGRQCRCCCSGLKAFFVRPDGAGRSCRLHPP